MGVVEVSCSGALVEVGGPGVGVVGVAGEVDDGSAELFVDCPAEGDDFDVAGLFGRGCGAGQTDQCFGGGEPSAGVTDLGEESGGEPPRSFRRPGLLSLPGRVETVSCSVVNLLGLDRGQVVDRLVGPLVVEPVDPVEGRELDVVDVAPGPRGGSARSCRARLNDSASALS